MRDGTLDGGDSGPLVPEDPGSPPPPPLKGAWGAWATLGWTALIIVVFFGVQTVVALVYLVALALVQGTEALSAGAVESDGTLLSVATIGSVPATLGLVALLIRLRNGPSIRDYLGLHWPGTKAAAIWIAALVLLLVLGDTVTVALGRPAVPDVMVQFYRNTKSLPLLWFAIVICAPLSEEVLCRGFMFRGLRDSRIGAAGAVLLTAVVFAALHTQYDLYNIVYVGLSGVLLAMARLKTGSLPLCIVMHATTNLIASVEVALLR